MTGYLIEYNFLDLAYEEYRTSFYWAHNNKVLTEKRNMLQRNFTWCDNNKKVRGGDFHTRLLIPVSYRIHVVEL
jgi:hypothetical protein